MIGRLFKSRLPHLIISDVNNDKKTEVLFSIISRDEFNSGKLVCLSQDGEKLWEFSAGSAISFGEEVFPDSFVINGFYKFDLNNDGYYEIVIFSNAKERFPTQLCVLNHIR
jgi:outer membrane protein assembly factor BamB